jgi:fatty acid-binding protein DegV
LIQIITDSAADLPPEIINKYSIHVVPLTVNIDGKEYTDGVDLDMGTTIATYAGLGGMVISF